MAWAITAAVTSAAISGYSAYSASSAANKQAKLTQENAARKYRLEAGISSQQMEEQQTIAMEEMTEVSRAFLMAKSTAEAERAEAGTSGVTAQRMKAVASTKESEAKGKVAKEIDTNVINIAQGMLANKINTDGIIADAQAKKRNVMVDTVLGAVQGGLSGYSMGKSMGGTSTPSSPTKFTNAELAGANVTTNNQLSTLGSFNLLTR